jgi:5-methyltetrahydropteroyltriglutamate--homocysteine methyltransferase
VKLSTERILTTHVGSLARPPELIAMMSGTGNGQLQDEPARAKTVRDAVADVVRKQVRAGLDIVNDGEQSKPSFRMYVDERLTGFERKPGGGQDLLGDLPGDLIDFPEYAASRRAAGEGQGRVPEPSMACTGPIAYRGQAAVQADIANLLGAVDGLATQEAFMTAASPAIIGVYRPNEYYLDEQAYLFAIADAMHEEYRAIVDAGLILQVDAPDLATIRTRLFRDLTLAQWRVKAELFVAAINRALTGILPERVRLHVCWGAGESPHHLDVPLVDVVDIILDANVGAYAVEAANGRHAHEWKVWKDVKLPPEKALIPGVIDNKTNIIEHPAAVAERLVRFADVVGRERVIGGVDCGFSTSAGTNLRCHPTVAYAKLATLAEGAKLATKELWK